jgi:hypothetical protein
MGRLHFRSAGVLDFIGDEGVLGISMTRALGDDHLLEGKHGIDPQFESNHTSTERDRSESGREARREAISPP